MKPFRCSYARHIVALMDPPRRYSVSPLPSICTVTPRPAQPFSVTLQAVVRWLANRQPEPPKSELQLQDRLVERLVEEMAENEPPAEAGLEDKPPIASKRPRRRDVGL
jgi:hypothetical protein